MALARLSLRRMNQIGFWKLFGSGIGEGFTPVPNTAVYAILCTWKDRDAARDTLRDAPVFKSYKAHASETWTVYLEPISARGQWSGQMPFTAQPQDRSGPLAALTRATIKPSILLKFWRRVPAISNVIGNDPNVAFKIGVGEVPWLHQVTFSIWPNEKTMADFARKSGPHARAIKAVRDEKWFREELYARFHVTDQTGSWDGANPLTNLLPEPAR